MKKRVFVLLGLFVLLLTVKTDIYAQNELLLIPTVTSAPPSAAREVIVVFKKKPTTASVLSVTSQHTNVKLENGITATNAMVFSIESGNTVAQTITSLSQNSNIQTVIPNRRLHVFTIPNDELILATPVPGRPRKQWNMFNLKLAGEGQTAWDKTTGAAQVVVAVIDTGVDSSHPDLAGKLASLIDCSTDPCQEKTSLTDAAGHGTHVAGLVAAATNNSVGMAGAGYNTKIMAIKLMGADGEMTLDHFVNALKWAADHGAKVINMSLGQLEENLDATSITLINNAVSYAWGKGALLVAAAGNCGGSTQGNNACAIVNDQGTVIGYGQNSKNYPGASPNVLSVAALRVDNTLASYSEHNDSGNTSIGNWISVGAPGGDCTSASDSYNCIASTVPTNQYAYMAGTSMASPQVAGVAALLFALNSNLTNAQAKNILETTADETIASGSTNHGAIDALAAVNAAGGSGGSGTPTVTLAASPTPLLSPTASPTVTPMPLQLPRTPPLPFPTGPQCPPSTNCSQKVLGDANCDNKIDEADYTIWKQQFDRIPAPLPINQNANFNCSDSYQQSNFIDMIDYEVWRKNKQ